MSTPHSRRLLTAALLGAGLLGVAPPLLMVAAPVASDIVIPLTPEDGRTGAPLELPMEPETGPVRTGALVVTARDTSLLVQADQVRLLMATYTTTPILKTARLRSADGACEFASAPGAIIENNEPLTLTRVQCEVTTPTLDMMLYVRVGEVGRAAVWSFEAGTSAVDEPLVVSAPDGSWQQVLRGDLHLPGDGTTVRRIDLIAYLWQTDVGRVWMWTGGLVLLLAMAIPLSIRSTTRPAALAVIAFAVAAAWAIVIPPLQGADEPDHLLSFSEVNFRADDEGALAALARRSHFERIRFHGGERFRAWDRGHPYPVAWTGDVHAEQMSRRSPTGAHVWRLFGTLGIADLPFPDRLLVLRLANALLFAAVVGLAVWGLQGAGGSAWCLLGLALIPTLPMFATTVSDWAFVTTWSIGLATAIVLLIDDGPSASWAGLALGVSLALLATTSVAALALAPLLVLILGTRIVLGPAAGPETGGVATAIFWGGLAGGLAVGYPLAGALFEVGFWRADATTGTGASLLGAVNEGVGLLARMPWLVLVGFALLALVERQLTAVRGRAGVTRVGRVIAHSALLIVGSVLLLTTLASLVVALPVVRTLPDGEYATMATYIWHVTLAALTVGRVQGFDHLTFSSFWGGFGWIDGVPPAAALSGLSAIVIAVVLGSLLALAGRHRVRSAGWLSAVLVGGMCSVAAYAAAGFLMHRNIHGRYLIALAVPVMAAMAYGTGAWLSPSQSGHVRSPLRLAMLAVICAIHGLSLAWILARYY